MKTTKYLLAIAITATLSFAVARADDDDATAPAGQVAAGFNQDRCHF